MISEINISVYIKAKTKADIMVSIISNYNNIKEEPIQEENSIHSVKCTDCQEFCQTQPHEFYDIYAANNVGTNEERVLSNQNY